MDGRVSRVLASHALASVGMSLPWPLLMVLVWRETGSDAWLGVTAGARMAPYVALSWWVPRLADRLRRDNLVRATLVIRSGLLLGTAGAIAHGAVVAAVVLATLTVAVATPAYPALAAGMPRLAAAESQRATDLLVTIEVASFVVGPAVGGILLGSPRLVAPAAAAATVAAWGLYAGIRQPRPAPSVIGAPGPSAGSSETAAATAPGSWAAGSAWSPTRGTRLALALLVLVNLVVATTGVTLIRLSESLWDAAPWGWSDATAYGLATGALGFGALGGPLLRRRSEPLGSRLRRGIVLLALGLLATAVAPALVWAVGPLLSVGAAAVAVEAAATEMLQRAVPDHRRAGVLGVADSAMVLAAMVGALAAPVMAGWWGPRHVVLGTAVGCLVAVAAAGRAGRLRRHDPVAVTASDV
jgi:Major Facilitator Superfamily